MVFLKLRLIYPVGPGMVGCMLLQMKYNIAPAGTDLDVVFHRSTNGGVTWSQGIRVNQDAINNGKNSTFPGYMC